MIFDVNVVNTLTLALTNLNATLAEAENRKSKTVNYLTYSKRDDEDIDNFIKDFEKAFAVNNIAAGR